MAVVPNNAVFIATADDLRAKTSVFYRTSKVVYLQGGAAFGDGGEGVFNWDPTSHAVADGITVIRPSDIMSGSPGRAIRTLENPAVRSFRMWQACGSTIGAADDAATAAGVDLLIDIDANLSGDRVFTAKTVLFDGVARIIRGAHAITGNFWAHDWVVMFDPDGTGFITFSNEVERVSYWFGAKPTGSDMAVPLRAFASACSHGSGKILGGLYTIASGVQFPANCNGKIRGLAKGLTVIDGASIDIVGITNISAAPVATVTTAAPHNLLTGYQATIAGLAPSTLATALNLLPFPVTVTGPNTYTIPADTSVLSAYAGGGSVVPPGVFICSGAGLTAIPALGSDVAIGDSTLHFSTTTGLVQGDLGSIWNPTAKSYSGWRNNYRAGEMFVVSTTADGTATVNIIGGAFANYVTSAVNVYKVSTATIEFADMTVKGPTSDTLSCPSIQITFNRNSGITNVETNGSSDKTCAVRKSYNTKLSRCDFIAFSQPSVASQFAGYGLSIGNSQIVIVEACTGIAFTHVYTSGGDGTPGSIVNRVLMIRNCVGFTTGGFAAALTFDLHGNTERSGFVGCYSADGARLGGNFNYVSDFSELSYVNKAAMVTSAGMAVRFSELSGCDHRVSDCDLYGQELNDSISQCVDVGGNSAAFNANTPSGGTMIFSNVRCHANDNATGSPIISIVNRGCTETINIIIDGGYIDSDDDMALGVEILANNGFSFGKIVYALSWTNAPVSIEGYVDLDMHNFNVDGNALVTPGVNLRGGFKTLVDGFDIHDAQQNAIYYNSNITIDNITLGSVTTIITKGNCNLLSTESVTITGILGSSWLATAINGIPFVATVTGPNTFTIPLNSTGQAPYTDGGQYTNVPAKSKTKFSNGIFDNWGIANSSADDNIGVRISHVDTATIANVDAGAIHAGSTGPAYKAFNVTNFRRKVCTGELQIDTATVVNVANDFYPSATAALTSGASISPNGGIADTFSVTLAMNGNLVALLYPQDGHTYRFQVVQNASAAKLLTYDPMYIFFGGSNTISTGLGAIDQITGTYYANLGKMVCRLDKAAA